MLKKLLSLSLVIILTFSITVPASASSNSDLNETICINSNDEENMRMIDELMEEKMLLLGTPGSEERIAQLDYQMRQLGLEEITYDEVLELTNTPKPYVVTPPSTSTVTWSKYSGTYSTGGKSYTFTRLTATPKSLSSNLWKTGSVTYRRYPDINAGALNAMKVVASGAVASIPKYGAAVVTCYDVLSGLVSGLQRSTTVEDIQATHVYNIKFTMQFYYFKPVGSSDLYENLSFITSMCVGTITTTIPSMTILTGTSHVTPKNLVYSVDMSARPSYYNDLDQAYRAYIGTTSQKKSCVNSITVYGYENALVGTVYESGISGPGSVY